MAETRKQTGDTFTFLKHNLIDIDRLAEYIDRNILTLRYLPYAVGLFGAAVLFRSIRLTSKFTSISQIPPSFFHKQVQLRGHIKVVDYDGSLLVEHLPILKMPWHAFYKDSLLNVRLAFIAPTLQGQYWMRLNVKTGKPIKFQLIDHNEDKSILWALVKAQLDEDSKRTLNETLTRKGLAKVRPIEREMLNNRGATMYSKLVDCQAKARKDGLGMWSDGHKESWLQASTQLVKRLVGKFTRPD